MPQILGVPTKRARFVDQLSRWALATSVFSLLASAAFAGTFGTVVPIGGHASDLALDEARGVVYVANYTANRIDVISTTTLLRTTTIATPAQPASLALSPDGRYLLVTHLSNYDPAVGTPNNGLTVISLGGTGYQIQNFAFGTPPLGVAFGNNGLALVVTTTDFMLFDPNSGYARAIASVAGATTNTLPVSIGQYPRDIIRASMSASGDGSRIFGTLEAGGATMTAEFQYDVASQQVKAQTWTNSPASGPRVVSVDRTGSFYLTGWTIHRADDFVSLAQFPNAVGDFAKGSHAIDTARKTIYAQVSMTSAPQVWPAGGTTYSGPVLMVTDSDNLAVREQLKLTQNLSGRSVLSANGDTMYSVCDSGLMVLPVGQLYVQGSKVSRVVASQESLLFTGNWCDRSIQTQQLTISDPGGGQTDFVVSTNMPGVTLSPSSGKTPATITVSIDPNAYQNLKGTQPGLIQIASSQAVNVSIPVQLLMSNPEPEQRGTILNVPGLLVDVLADPVRNRFYVLRQDRNLVLIFDASNNHQIGTLRTGNTPWSMATTLDKRYLLIGADNSQVAHLYDLDTWQFQKYIVMPSGHYPRRIAVAGRTILAACRVAGPLHKIDRMQLWGLATEYPTLGIFDNDINEDTALAASPSGSSILVAMADGRTMLYDSNTDTFVVGRKDFTALSGPVVALSDDQFLVGDNVLDASLGLIGTLETSNGTSSGFALVDGQGLRTMAPNKSSPGVVERVDLSLLPFIVRPTRMIEAPLVPDTTTVTVPEDCQDVFGQILCKPATTTTATAGSVFNRTLAPLTNRSAIVSLSTSGLLVLPWNYDVAVASPLITAVVNAADRSTNVAPGSLISVLGQNLSPVNAATDQIPLPTALANSCLTVNGELVPMIMVSPTQINGQLPLDVIGPGSMVLHTPAGVSNTFIFPIQGTAPAPFWVDVPGFDGQLPTVTHAADGVLVTPSYPIHLDEWIVIYMTGLGKTLPEVASGEPGPFDPLAEVVLTPTVTLGGTGLPVSFAGLTPGSVGVYQINAKVLFKGVPTGMAVPLKITQDGSSTTVYVRVVD
jgi:uncharacterized protein (TIGR03437 family)